MKKILGIIAAILLCALTASASPMTATSTGPPPAASSANAQLGQDSLASHESMVAVSDISICFTNVIFATDHNDVAGDTDLILFDTALIGLISRSRVADSDIELWMNNTAIFMGDETDGLLKGPCSNNIATAKLEATPASATEVDNPANAGKTDAALFMSTAPSTGDVAFIHSPRDDVKGSCGLICEI